MDKKYNELKEEREIHKFLSELTEEQMKRIASDKETSPYILDAIPKWFQTKKNISVETLTLVAINPNTMGSTLDFLTTSSYNRVWNVIASNYSNPDSFYIKKKLDYLFEELHFAIVLHPNANKFNVMQIVGRMKDSMRENISLEIIAARRDMSRRDLRYLIEKAVYKHDTFEPGDNFKAFLRRNLECGKASFESWMEYVATNPNTSKDDLELLSVSKNPLVLQGLAKNHNTPAETLVAMAKKELLRGKYMDNRLLLCVANNPNTPTEFLPTLAEVNDKNIRLAVMGRSDAPIEFLIGCFGLTEFEYKVEVASNPNTPAKFLSMLAGDEDDLVQYQVASNPNTPKEAFLVLMKSENEQVVEMARDTLKVRFGIEIAEKNYQEDTLTHGEIPRFTLSEIQSFGATVVDSTQKPEIRNGKCCYTLDQTTFPKQHPAEYAKVQAYLKDDKLSKVPMKKLIEKAKAEVKAEKVRGMVMYGPENSQGKSKGMK